MFARRNTLVQALNDLDTGGLPNAEIIIVSCAWWESLSTAEQTAIEGVAEKAMVKPGTVKRDNPDNKPRLSRL